MEVAGSVRMQAQEGSPRQEMADTSNEPGDSSEMLAEEQQEGVRADGTLPREKRLQKVTTRVIGPEWAK